MNLAPLLTFCAFLSVNSFAQDIESWTTTADLKLTLHHERFAFESVRSDEAKVIVVNPARVFQTILGLGASFEHSTCSNLFRLSPAEREQAIRDLVDARNGAGMNLMRICIGTSDFTGESWYSYDEVRVGESDPELRRFTIERDRSYILPVLKQARAINPELLFFASPWSPPGWMKTKGTMIGGELLPKYYASYAEYFVRFIREYEAEGIPIYAITVQNEPGVDRAKGKPEWYYPSCHWTGAQERDFIREHLGPALRRAGLKTRIWCYDHNYNVEPAGDSPGLAYPRTILTDVKAAQFVGGVAFHHYEGKPSGMTRFHEEFPKTSIHFSEGSVFSIYGGHDIIERLRSWAESYNAWVSILDEAGKPNLGPFPATLAILRLNSKSGRCEKALEYYNYAHFSKFVQRGSHRIESTEGSVDLNNIAFLNPDGTIVAILVNTTATPTNAFILAAGRQAGFAMPAQAIRTLRWRAGQ